ncbi:MAG: carbohydrate ABC transporter permease [Actinomycetota bacterium]|nr:carbohydrate ABC transporter permease [Actinomycetota bacterium]
MLAIVSVGLMYPFYFMVMTSFKSETQYELGRGFSLASWTELFSSVPVAREIANSLGICAVSISCILVISTTAGFALAKTEFRGRRFTMLAIIGAMMIPVQSMIIAEYVNFSKIHIINTYAGAIAVYVAIGTPFATFLMSTYFRGIPEELIDAGRCDGLTYTGCFWRIAVPLAKPAFATVVVLQFIPIWNDLLIGLLFLQEPNVRTFTVGLGVLASSRVVNVPSLMAGSLLSTVPAAVVYVVFQRFLVRGLTLGAAR